MSRPWRWLGSLRWRLLAATLVALLVALALAGVLLASLFRDHVRQQLEATLTAQLDQVTARLDFDAAGQPRLDASRLTDPRWSRPYGGLYWQVDALDGALQQRGVLRSRSLWDSVLVVAADALPDGVVHVHEVPGPDGTRLLLVERTVRGASGATMNWRLLVAADQRETAAALARFNGVLAASLAVLLGLLGLAAVAQGAVGLAPLRALQRALAAVHEGRAQRLSGRLPVEVQPLIDDFNAVLDRNAEVVARARTQAGNLAHALKTPLSVLANAANAGDAAHPELARLVVEQVAIAQQQVDYHLARAQAAATSRIPGTRTPLQAVVEGLVRAMRRIHAEREIEIAIRPFPESLSFRGEAQDLQEMLGNLLDNACKWASRKVELDARSEGTNLIVTIDDDGSGLAAERRDAVMQRGVRADQQVPGSGLGLAIVDDLARLYGGQVQLGDSPAGGLRAELTLPGSP